MAHTETMLESKEIFNGRVIRVTVDKVQLEDGTTSTREIVHHHGGACILPVDADGSVTMVRQFRYAFGEEIWELPAGKLEADEDPFEAAKRELSEECGLTADHFVDLGIVYATVGYDSEKIYLWAATGLHEVRQHLAELGFVVGETVTVVNEISGNLILQVKEARIALDKTLAMRIIVA